MQYTICNLDFLVSQFSTHHSDITANLRKKLDNYSYNWTNRRNNQSILFGVIPCFAFGALNTPPPSPTLLFLNKFSVEGSNPTGPYPNPIPNHSEHLT